MKGMTKAQFAKRWDKDVYGDGITNDECAECYIAWGLGDNPRTLPIKTVVDRVVEASGAKDNNHVYNTNQITG